MKAIQLNDANHRLSSVPPGARRPRAGSRPAAFTLTAGALAALTSLAAQASNCTDAPVSGRVYNIVNEGSGLYLDVQGASKDDGATLIQWASNGAANQRYTVTALNDGWSIRPLHDQKSVDVYGWQTADGTPVKQWSYYGNANQQFNLNATGSGAFNIVSSYSKKLVSVKDNGAGSAVYQDSDRSSANQRWFLNPVDGKCARPSSGSFGSFLGSSKLLVGVSSTDANTLGSAPFDARYAYLAGGPAPDPSCLSKYTAICDGWWGTWQDRNLAPGEYVKGMITGNAAATYNGAARPRITMITYYLFLAASGGTEGAAEVAGMANTTVLKRYLDDWRFTLQSVGQSKAMLQIEPDLWGFVRSVNPDPHAVPAQVQAANATDCGWYENSAAGLARCMIAMAHKYAPNAAVGLHGSWWSGSVADATAFMKALGAGDGDFVTSDPADRDAAYYQIMKGDNSKWWNDTSFASYLAWDKALAEAVGKPVVLWQIPLGNGNQNNTANHWQDNKVDYLFSRINDVANAHVAAMMFGAGQGDQTSPESDGGNLVRKTKDLASKGGVGLR